MKDRYDVGGEYAGGPVDVQETPTKSTDIKIIREEVDAFPLLGFEYKSVPLSYKVALACVEKTCEHYDKHVHNKSPDFMIRYLRDKWYKHANKWGTPIEWNYPIECFIRFRAAGMTYMDAVKKLLT